MYGAGTALEAVPAGGVTVYTRDRRMNSDYITDIEKAMGKVRLSFATFQQNVHKPSGGHRSARSPPTPLQAALLASVHCALLVQVGLSWSDMRLVDNTCKPHPNPNVQDRILGGLQDLDPEQTNPDPSPFEPMTNSKII